MLKFNLYYECIYDLVNFRVIMKEEFFTVGSDILRGTLLYIAPPSKFETRQLRFYK